MGGPDLLKWGLPGGGIKSAKVAPTPYVYYPPVRVFRNATGVRCACASRDKDNTAVVNSKKRKVRARCAGCKGQSQSHAGK